MDVTLTDAARRRRGHRVGLFHLRLVPGFAAVMFSFCFEMALCKRDLFRMLLENFVRVDMVETYAENGRFVISRKRLRRTARRCVSRSCSRSYRSS